MAQQGKARRSYQKKLNILADLAPLTIPDQENRSRRRVLDA